MADSRVQSVLIVGGGTAGWMTASVLLQILGKGFPIHLIESDEISTVGVGEATIPSIRKFNRLCGINEDEFVRQTQATFKLGIQFRNWGALGDSYIHSFGLIGKDMGHIDFYHYWLKMFQAGEAGPLDDYSINSTASAHNKFTRAPPDAAEKRSPLALMAHAFHFDAGLYANYLKTNCVKYGVKRTEGKIVSVQTHPETGFVTSVTLENGDVHTADLFIDCSGFRGLLIEQTLRTGYDDWSRYLPCDRALAVPCTSVTPLTPYTRSTAHSAGWQWRIPLQSRIGNGHVFCSEFMSQDEATSILLGNLDGEPLAEPRLIRFVTGKRKKFWNKNVVAIGLAAGFIEPLESTSIHLIQSAVLRLIQLFPSRTFAEADADEYNRQTALEFEQVRDFIVLHYHLNQREDSPFWRRCREMEIPSTLAEKMDLFRANGRVFRAHNELFGETAWLQVMVGQGLLPGAYDPLVDTMPVEQITKVLANVSDVVGRIVAQMPTHAEFIAKNCKAKPIESAGR
jgi:tryptophan 7-halogenase